MTNFNDNRIAKNNSLWKQRLKVIHEKTSKSAKSHQRTPSTKLIKNLHIRLVLRDVISQACEDMTKGLVVDSNNPLALALVSKDTTPSHDIENLIHYLQKANKNEINKIQKTMNLYR
jgi:hypothetical protein